MTKAQVKADMDALLEKVRLIEEYANHVVAHRSERPMASELPTFKDLKDTMKFLERLLQKYYLLIRGMDMSEIDIGGTFTYDWKEIFTFPWIRSGRTRRRRRASGSLISARGGVRVRRR